jgi:hypothetical protein
LTSFSWSTDFHMFTSISFPLLGQFLHWHTT